MDQLMAIPTDRLQVLDAVRATVRAISSMVNLEGSSAATSCAPPSMLLDCSAAMHPIDAVHKSFEGNPIHRPRSLHDQSRPLERSQCELASFRHELPDFIAGQT